MNRTACRLIVVLASIGSLAWAMTMLLRPDQTVLLNGIATRIISGDSFEPSTLEGLDLDAIDRRPVCNALEIRSAAVIRLRLYENSITASDPPLADQRLKKLRSTIDLALSCVPTEGFLWFLRYWTATASGDLRADRFDNLALSYQTSPLEGWIAARRNIYALAVYHELRETTQTAIRREFLGLVSSGLLNDAARSLMGPGWGLRDELVAGLAQADPAMRQYFSNLLYSEGVDIDIPGTNSLTRRPWR